MLLGRRAGRTGEARARLIDAHERGDVRGAQQRQQAVLRDEAERVGAAQAQQDGQRQVEAAGQLVQVRGRLQQCVAVAARAADPARARDRPRSRPPRPGPRPAAAAAVAPGPPRRVAAGTRGNNWSTPSDATCVPSPCRPHANNGRKQLGGGARAPLHNCLGERGDGVQGGRPGAQQRQQPLVVGRRQQERVQHELVRGLRGVQG